MMKYLPLLLLFIACYCSSCEELDNPYKGAPDCEYQLPEPWVLFYNPFTKQYSVGWYSEFYNDNKFLGCDNPYGIYSKNERADKMEKFSDSCEAKGFFKRWLYDSDRYDAEYDFRPITPKP